MKLKRFNGTYRIAVALIDALMMGAIVQGRRDETGAMCYEVLYKGTVAPIERGLIERLQATFAILQQTIYRRTSRKVYFRLYPPLRASIKSIPVETVSVLMDLADGWTLAVQRAWIRPGRRYWLARGRETRPVGGRASDSLIARNLVSLKHEANGVGFYHLSRVGRVAAAYLAARAQLPKHLPLQESSNG